MRIERLRTSYRIGIQYVQFPLHPDTPQEGLTLEQLFAGRDLDIDASQRRMAQLAEDEGLPYGHRAMTFNSRRAQELAKWAETQEAGEQIHDALFRAYFADGMNIASIDNLLPLVESIGLSVDGARDALVAGSFRDPVDADWRRSKEMGVTGVPTFVAGGKVLVGAQPYEALEHLVLEAGAIAR